MSAQSKDEARGSFEEGIRQLRQGIEALVLEGNTDKQRYAREQIPAIGGVGNAREKPEGFVKNAYLGSERARQALGHLLHVVRDHDQGPDDALEVLMSRVRIESPSFGRYQVGPLAWRRTERGYEVGDALPGSGEKTVPACMSDKDDGRCELARNLSLRLRWKKRALRRPFTEIQGWICGLLRLGDQEPSALARGLEVVRSNARLRNSVERALGPIDPAGLDVDELRRRFDCDAYSANK